MDSPQKPRVCISLCEPNVAALKLAITAAAEVCDLIEVRLDCLDPFDRMTDESSIVTLLKKASCESILAYRPAEQGGRRALDYGTRYMFWVSHFYPSETLFDIELDLAEGFNSTPSPPPASIDWSRIVCSHHDYVGGSGDLVQIYERMARTSARVLKIAVQVDDAIDCLPIFRLLERARNEGREMIAIAMGPAGLATRILGPSRGAFLTYASLESGTATAPGQPTARDLRELYRIERIDRNTQIFGLIGRPVSHSVSPMMHNAAFAAAGMNAVYIPFAVRDVKAFIKRMIHPRTRELNWNIRGLSVTAPHKSDVMDQLDWIEPAAKEIGAVNTIMVEGEALWGFNTDAIGFLQPLVERLGELRGARCAIIGAGGAASAALWGLEQAGANTTLFARNVEKGRGLAERFGATLMKLDEARFDGYDIVINATPAGTAGKLADETPATTEQLRGARLAYDIVYNPTETRFLREAHAAGCETLGGLPMLVAQAVEQFRLWTGAAAPEDVMLDAAQHGLRKI